MGDFRLKIVIIIFLTNCSNFVHLRLIPPQNKVSEEVCSKVAIMLEECGGLDLVEKLQEHENERIYAKSALVSKVFKLPVPPSYVKHF